MHVLYLTSDLMFSSRATGVIHSFGGSIEVVSSAAELVRCATTQHVQLVILDLSLPGFEPESTVVALRNLVQPPDAIVAYAPHVHKQKLVAATSAGCDEVLSQGAFDRELQRIVRSYENGSA